MSNGLVQVSSLGLEDSCLSCIEDYVLAIVMKGG